MYGCLLLLDPEPNSVEQPGLHEMALFAKSQSSAVKIVNPSTHDEPKTPSRKGLRPPHVSSLPLLIATPGPDSVQRQCRNVMIYGHVLPALHFVNKVQSPPFHRYCKYQDKGCTFSHPSVRSSLPCIPRYLQLTLSLVGTITPSVCP